MLAKSRTASESGRVTRMPISSMMNTSGRIALGTPGGIVADLKYLIGPCDLMPMTWYESHTRMAMNAGRAMRAFTGIWTPGIRPQMLQVKMKVKSVSR